MSRIVVAAADTEIRLTLERLYHQVDYNFIQTTNGDQCLAAAAQERPDLILLDSELPDTDTFTLCARLFAMTRAPILMMIPDAIQAAENAFAAGASDVITRPIHLTTLHYRLRHFLQVSEVNVLLQQEEWYHSIVENALGGIYRSTMDGRFLFVNRALVRMLGYETIDEVMALNISTDLHYSPDARQRYLAHLEAKTQVDGVEIVWKKQDGTPLIVNVYGRMIRDLQGEVLYYEGIAFDITERKRIEAAEREQRQLVEALGSAAATLNNVLSLNAVLDGILSCVHQIMPDDLTNIFLIEGDAARSVRRYGYAERHVEDFVEDLRLNVRETPTLLQMIESQHPLIIEDVHSYPGWVVFKGFEWAQAFIGAPIRVGGEVIGFLTVDSVERGAFSQSQADALQAFADQAGIAIHNARLFEASRQHTTQLEARVAERTAELERERAQLQIILDSMGEGVAIVLHGEDRKAAPYRYANRAFFDLLGYRAEDYDPILLKLDGVPDEDYQALANAISASVLETGVWSGNLRVRRKDGREIDTHLLVTRVDRPDGRPFGSVSVFRDISQEKVLEARQARFVASAAHELRTPLTSLKTRLYLAQAQPDQAERHLPILERVLDQMQALVEDMLDLSRFTNGLITLHRAPIDLRTFIAGIAEVQGVEAELKGITLTSEFQNEVPSVKADATRLNQVVANLLTNAIQHTGTGGRITIRVLSGSGEDEAAYTIIEIEDTGEGIPPEHLPHIFEPFYRASRGSGKGMGLGLSISKEIIEMHRGQLVAHSEVGKGTTFSIWLPESD